MEISGYLFMNQFYFILLKNVFIVCLIVRYLSITYQSEFYKLKLKNIYLLNSPVGSLTFLLY